MSFKAVEDFEKEIASFFGSPYAIAVDCCTHGLELCLRLENSKEIFVPKRTYLSVPMLANKLNLELALNWQVQCAADVVTVGRACRSPPRSGAVVGRRFLCLVHARLLAQPHDTAPITRGIISHIISHILFTR